MKQKCKKMIKKQYLKINHRTCNPITPSRILSSFVLFVEHSHTDVFVERVFEHDHGNGRFS